VSREGESGRAAGRPTPRDHDVMRRFAHSAS
jgi:hypothetical protein